MEQCTFCQGSVDPTSGICPHCCRMAQEDLLDQPTAVRLQQALAEDQCPRCGEATISGQRFCRRCGLALPKLHGKQDDQLVAQVAGSKASEAEASADSAHSFPTSPGSSESWWEAPTQPVVPLNTVGDQSSRFSRRRAWLSIVLVLVCVSSISGYLILHAQTRGAGSSISQVSTPQPSPAGGQTPPATAVPAGPVGTGYWHTNGTQIVDASNQPVRIAGINWFGFETSSYVVHGLGQRDYHDLLREIKSLGYNTVRLPFSDQLFFANSAPNGISFNNMNLDLQGLTGLQIMDKIVAYAGQLGLRVILDHHTMDADKQIALWSTADCSASCFEADWQMLATHYLGNTTVIGADLDNEPHSPACWGCGDPSLDWQMEAQKLGNEIVAINPHWLIFVEGVECYKGDCYWWGGNLEGVADTPVRLTVPNQIVYSPHDYPPDVYNLSYFNAPDYPDNLPGIWDSHWGFIVHQHIAPVWLGEFGTLLNTTKDQQWLESMVAYLGGGVTGINWTYWALNPDSADTGGILQNDWTAVNQNKQDYLTPIEFPLKGGS